MNSEDEKFVQSLNCWEDNYDVITDNIQKLSGMLSLQIQLLQNVQEEKEHQRNVRHMTLEEQNISRMLNSFEQRFNVELSKLTDFSNKLDTLLTGQQILVTRVAQIEEKLSKEFTVNSPISVSGGDKNVGVDINEHFYRLAKKVERRTSAPKRVTNEEFTQRLKEIDWDKILEPKIKIACKDEKGEVFTLDGTIKEDGSIVCEPMTESRTIVDWSFTKDIKSKEFNDGRPKVLVEDEKKRKSSIFTEDGKQFWVFKKKREKFVKVGTAEIVGEPPIVRITFLNDYKKEYVENPSSYEYGFWTMTDYGGSSWLGYQKNLLESYQFKYNFTELTSPEGVTGYLTDEGRAIYYDQYL